MTIRIFSQNRLVRPCLTALAVVMLCMGAPAQAQDTFTAEQKQALEAMMKDYLMNNGQVIMEAVNKYQADQEKAEQQKAMEKVKEHMAYLTAADAPAAGNPKGDVTIIEFFDYNCGYCKRALPDIQDIIKTDGNVRFVFRELPILGPTSKSAAQWALAAHKQGKYFEYHSALMNFRGSKDDAALEKMAGDVGLDVAQAKKDVASAEIAAALQKDLDVARDIGVNGTPAFIVGDQFFPGYIGKDGLLEAIKAARTPAAQDTPAQ